jgi:hypothetical protein
MARWTINRFPPPSGSRKDSVGQSHDWFAIALAAVVVGACLGPFAVGIAVEAGKRSGGVGAVAACLGLFGAPAIAMVRLRHRKASLAFKTLALTYLILFTMIADGVALALGGVATVVLQSAVAAAALGMAFKVHPRGLDE